MGLQSETTSGCLGLDPASVVILSTVSPHMHVVRTRVGHIHEDNIYLTPFLGFDVGLEAIALSSWFRGPRGPLVYVHAVPPLTS